jgi:hypothetical protein
MSKAYTNVLKLNEIVSPLDFGAKADARVVDDGVSNGTTTITSATAIFTSADVGKAIWLGLSISAVRTTIVSVTSATTVVVATSISAGSPLRLIIGTDDTAAWQSTLDLAEATGRGISMPSGWSAITAPLLYSTATAPGLDPTAGRRSGLVMSGASATSCGFYSLHDGIFLDIRYASGDGLSTWLRISGIAFHGPLRRSGSIGLKIDNCAYFEIENCDIAYFERGIVATDMLSGVFGESTIRLNSQGVEISYSDFSRPNSITFRDCIFATNYTWAGLLVGAACVRIIGGSIEGNGIGLPLADTGAWGFKAVDCGVEGGIGLDVSGACYIEGNNGAADIWIDQQNNEALHNISASFIRYLSGQYVTANILFTRDAARTSSFVRVAGSMFKALNTYVEDVNRPYIDAPVGTIFDGGSNTFNSATAKRGRVFTPGFIPRTTFTSPPPDATLWPGRMIVVTNAAGLQQPLVSSSVQWRRIETNWTSIDFNVDTVLTALQNQRDITLYGTITADRKVILSLTSAFTTACDIGDTFIISRIAAGAFNVEVRNGTSGGTLLATLAANQWAEFKFDGSNWLKFASGAV